MSVLSDRDIRERLKKGDLVIEPLEPFQIRSASVDFRLGNKFRIFQTSSKTHIDIARHETVGDYTHLIEVKEGEPFIVHPNEFVLGSVIEFIKIPHDLIGILHGRSSIGRLGIQVHATSGFVNPGYYGNLTLEMSNICRVPIALYPKMRICQIMFQKLESIPEFTEPDKYAGDREPTLSRIHKDNQGKRE